MKLLIIGHSVVDHINDEIKPGGIYYTSTGLYNYKDNDDEIYLLTSVSELSSFHFNSLYSQINMKFAQLVNEIPTVVLKIHKTKERDECYLNLTDKLRVDPQINYEIFNGILINMITGFDIELNDLKMIRSRFKGPIYFDVHTFSRGMDENHRRKFRPVPESAEWLKCIDILQANETEIKTLSSQIELNAIADEILNKGVKYLIITRGAEGASLYFKSASTIKSIHENAINVKAANSIGCGDIFGAVFFYSYIKSGNPEAALKFANAAAGVITTYNNFMDYKKLKQDAERYIN